ncbi:MAG: single-stranded-DNA-specific exonuclease RecJ [bacterium]
MKWKISPKIKEKERKLYGKLDPILSQLLFNREILDKKSAEKFINPSWDELYDPFDLFDVKSAVKRIEKAIKKKEKIIIHGDYDVDGMSATAILWDYLYRKRKADVIPYIPSRVDEGYGLSEESVSKLKEQGAQLIITVDCGIRDYELVDKEDLDFIIVDHHQPGEQISKKAIVVHPMHPEKQYPFESISGCAVTWKLICAMEKSRNLKNFNISKVEGIDLVALSTVTDIMPLKDENRIFVSLGLEKMKKDPNLGLDSLVSVSQIDIKSIDTYHLGFMIGPRLNAAGRIGDPMDGVRLLSTKEITVADRLSKELSDLNSKRQEMTEDVMNQVKEITDGKDDFLFFAQKDGWSEGIIGLAAGKVLEEVYRPVIVATGDGDIIRGSARSIVGFNITDAIENFSDLLEKYGGHAQAAGFTIKRKNLKEFEEGMKKLAKEKLKDKDLEREIKIDMEIDSTEVDWELVKVVEKLKPYGVGNRRPLFLIRDIVVVSSQGISEDKHMKFSIKGEDSEFISCIFFNSNDWLKKLKPGTIIDIVGVPEVNVWNGSQNLQFNVTDVRVAK